MSIKIERLVNTIRELYLNNRDLIEHINDSFCISCPSRVNGGCPIEDGSDCKYTNEEIFNDWIKKFEK